MANITPPFVVVQGAALEVTTRITDAVLSDTRVSTFFVPIKTTVNRVSIVVAVTQVVSQLEVAIYDNNFNQVATTEAREIPVVGVAQLALPTTVLQAGTYHLVFTTNATTAQFGVNSYREGQNKVAVAPLPSSLTGLTAGAIVQPSALLRPPSLVAPTPFDNSSFAVSGMGGVRVYGIDSVNGNVYGWNTLTGKVAVSVNSGSTWTDLMNMPSTGSGTIQDLLVDNAASKIYIFTNTCTLFVSSNLSASATWTDISAPIDETNMRHANAIGRPYGAIIFGGYVWIGEYSAAPNELTGGPRILRYNISTSTWAISKQFSGARHIHSFHAPGTSLMWVSIGDAGYGTDIGVHRVTPSVIGTGAGGTDAWVKWSGFGAGYSAHYGVDLLHLTSVAGVADGLYLSSDRVGYQILYSKTAGNPSGFNISPQIFKPLDISTETVRSLLLDANNNLWYWTAESSAQALYVSPPPYVQAYRMVDYSASATLFLSRAVKSGNWLMMFDKRWPTVKFPGQ